MRVVSRFDRLYRDNFPFVWAAAHRCGAPDDVVDDVVQDVFVTAYRRLDELHWEVSPRGWLYGVTRRVAFRYRRSAARTARRKSAVAASANRSEHPHHRRDAARALEAILEQVDERQREVFVMAELLGMSAPEIAAELETPLNTVYSRLRLARKRLASIAGSEARLAAEVAATQRCEQPSRRDQERTYAALMPLLGSSWFPVKAGAVAAAKSAVIPAVAVSVALATYLIAGAAKDTSNDTPSEPEVSDAGASRTPSPPPKPSEPTEGAAPKVATAAVSPTPTLPPPTPASAVLRANETSPAATATPPPVETVAQPTPISADALAAEVALIDQAKAALGTGDVAAALTSLDAHARQFPRGQLAEARAATRVRALCKAGRTAEAQTAADALHRTYPKSNLAQQTPRKCPTS